MRAARRAAATNPESVALACSRRTIDMMATSSGRAEHEQEHPRGLGRFHGVRNVAGHPDDCPWRCMYARIADREIHRSFEDHHERIERRAVFLEFLSGVESKQREVAARSSGENAAGDAAGRGRDE